MVYQPTLVGWYQIYFYTNNQFCFKQFSFAKVRSLIIKTVLFQVIQFTMSTHSSSIWPIDRALSGATIPGQSEPGSDGHEAPALLKPHHQIV